MASVVKRRSPTERREAILKAAGEVFFEQGYAATSIDAIIERLGGSKRNIYNEFRNKEGLFVALVSASAQSAVATLSVDLSESHSLREVLMAFGRQLMVLYTSPALLGAYRAVVSEAQRFPKLAKAFYEQGPGRTEDRLAEVLRKAVERGDACIDDCAIAASHFMGMLRDNLHLKMLLGLMEPPAARQVENVVTVAVDIFLKGVSTGQGPVESRRRRDRSRSRGNGRS